MNQQEWLEWRRKGVGASDSIVLMGVVPKEWEINTPHKLYMNKVHNQTSKETTSMQRGKEFEEKGIKWFGKKIGEIFLTQRPYEHPQQNYIRATFDGINMEESISMELKICKKEFYEQIESGEIPVVYKPQVIHQMYVKPTNNHILAAYNPDYDEGAYVVVKEDPEYMKEVISRAETFWWSNVVAGISPDLTDWDLTIIEDEKIIDKAFQLYELNISLKEIESKIKKLKEEILKEVEYKYTDVGPYRITPSKLEEGRVDMEIVPPEIKKLLDQYRGLPIQKNPSFRLK